MIETERTLSLSRALWILLLLLAVSPAEASLHAQAVRVQLVDGRSGHPIAGACVNVWVGEKQKAAMSIPTDKDGVASLRLTNEDTNTQDQSKQCGVFGVVNPMAKYADSIRINVGYVLCRPRERDYSWLSTATFSTDKVLSLGVVTPNNCGKAVASPQAGEIVLFVRPLTLWEELRE